MARPEGLTCWYAAGRQAGKLTIGPDGLLQLPTDPALNPAQVPGWWLGLEMRQTLFPREHNAICDRLLVEYPEWSDDRVFAYARLILAALIARIHTVEWTLALISHPTSQAAMRADWWELETERLQRLFGRLGKGELIADQPLWRSLCSDRGMYDCLSYACIRSSRTIFLSARLTITG